MWYVCCMEAFAHTSTALRATRDIQRTVDASRFTAGQRADTAARVARLERRLARMDVPRMRQLVALCKAKLPEDIVERIFRFVAAERLKRSLIDFFSMFTMSHFLRMSALRVRTKAEARFQTVALSDILTGTCYRGHCSTPSREHLNLVGLTFYWRNQTLCYSSPKKPGCESGIELCSTEINSVSIVTFLNVECSWVQLKRASERWHLRCHLPPLRR